MKSDSWRLKLLTVTDLYLVANVHDTLDWLASKRGFSVFDLKDTFYQMELDLNSKDCAANRTVLKVLQFSPITQRIENFLGTFQRIFNTVLGNKKGNNV